MKCYYCGNTLPEESSFCNTCGKRCTTQEKIQMKRVDGALLAYAFIMVTILAYIFSGNDHNSSMMTLIMAAIEIMCMLPIIFLKRITEDKNKIALSVTWILWFVFLVIYSAITNINRGNYNSNSRIEDSSVLIFLLILNVIISVVVLVTCIIKSKLQNYNIKVLKTVAISFFVACLMDILFIIGMVITVIADISLFGLQFDF